MDTKRWQKLNEIRITIELEARWSRKRQTRQSFTVRDKLNKEFMHGSISFVLILLANGRFEEWTEWMDVN